MPRPTKINPERGNARQRLLEAAMDLIRRKGFTGATVEDLCREAEVTKGAYFHHFPTKEALGVAAAEHWTETVTPLFADAPYHKHDDPLERVLGYIDFRRSLIGDDPVQFSCVAGTMAQETFVTSPAIRDASCESMFRHACTLMPDIEETIEAQGVVPDGLSAKGLAVHIQAVLQGAFIVAKAADNPKLARDSIDHLRRYVEVTLGGCCSNRDAAHELTVGGEGR